jgi:hypothetical protein
MFWYSSYTPILLKMQFSFQSNSRAAFLDVHRGQREDLGPLFLPELCRHHTAHSRSDGLAGLVDEYAGVVVELDHAAVRPLPLFGRPYDYRLPYISAPHLVRGADGDAVARFRAKVALFFYDHHYPVACSRQYPRRTAMVPGHVPTLAARLERRTLTHSTMAAPELSMQLMRV